MIFAVYKKGEQIKKASNQFALSQDLWDDYHYRTTFYASYIDQTGELYELGSVQIGFQGMQIGSVIDYLGTTFYELPDGFFSLGASEEYYEKIATLDDSIRKQIFIALRDLAFNLESFDRYRNEDVVSTSLLRSKTEFTVRNQLHRMSMGGVKLTSYKFSYVSALPKSENDFRSVDLAFDVVPYTLPPTNMHVLIGRNGTGKTRMVQNMMMALQTGDEEYGEFYNRNEPNYSGDPAFANVVCIAFSPFDDFSQVVKCAEGGELPFSYIGLDKKSPDLLATIQMQFSNYFSNCMQSNKKKRRWINTIEILRSDPVFDESQVMLFDDIWEMDKTMEKSIAKRNIATIFSKLSSGHKVTLLIITACVDKIEEKSIVFLDEPENHLHPPLLSSFARALSYLLNERNGVAVISTHSPVILQEVPKSCVWTLQRTNTIIKAERPSIETFGTSISSLTSEVFGLEVTESGFHKIILDTVFEEKHAGYEEIAKKFDYQLGNEAQALLRTLIAQSNKC